MKPFGLYEAVKALLICQGSIKLLGRWELAVAHRRCRTFSKRARIALSFFYLFLGVLAVAEGDDKVFPTRENRPEFFAKLPD